MKTRNFAIDILRSLAIIGVILVHVSGAYVDQFMQLGAGNWWFAHGINSAMRFCVPVFVMISGALLLGRDEPYEMFIKKRFLRVFFPYLIWNSLYTFYTSIGHDIHLLEIVKKLILGSAPNYWFVFMILGLYLFIPIINPWIRGASKKELSIFIILWFLASNLQVFFPNISFGWDLKYFGGFLGYAVLGYFMSHFILKLGKSVLFYLLGTAIIFLGVYQTSENAGSINVLFYNYTSFGVIFSSVGVFGILYSLFSEKSSIPKIFINLSAWSYGIYLVHPFWIHWILDSLAWQEHMSWYIIPIASVGVFLSSIVTLVITKRIPKIGELTQ